MVKDIDGKKFREMIDEEGDQLEIIDVREKDEYDEIRVKNSKLIPMDEVGSRIDDIDWSKKVVFVCRSGARSRYIADVLAQSGKDIVNLSGGIYALDRDECDCLEKGK